VAFGIECPYWVSFFWVAALNGGDGIMERPAVVDAHVHFWDPRELTYPWLNEVAPLQRAFLPSAYREATAPARIDKVMFIECNSLPTQNLAEVALIERMRQQDGRISGIVAYVDLTDTRSRDRTLDLLSIHQLVKGIRHNIQGEPAGFALQRSFVEGVLAVAAAGFTFDLCVTHNQLAETIELVAQCPAVRFALDHCGKPSIRAALVEPWLTHMRALAAFGNVSCKISGLLSEASQPWRPEAVTPYVLRAVDAFGMDRVMFGSDWPVVTLAGRFLDWYDLTWRIAASWTAHEQRRFYHDNAVSFYGLLDNASTTG